MNTMPLRFDSPPKATATRGPVVRARHHKIACAALGEILAGNATRGMSAAALGALTALVQATLERPDLLECGSRQTVEQARLAMAMRGSSHQDIEFAFMAMVANGIAQIDPGDPELLCLPTVDRVIAQTLAGATNRSLGWAKRTGQGSSASPGAVVSPVGPAVSVPVAPVGAHQAQVPSSPLPVAPPASVGQTKRGKKAAPAQPQATDPMVLRAPNQGGDEVDPIFIKMPCKAGHVLVAKSYIAYLRETFQSIDVEEQIRLAVAWCRVGEESQGTPMEKAHANRLKLPVAIKGFLTKWMTRATQDASIRNDLRRHARSGSNGFGQGGSYVAELTQSSDGLPSPRNASDGLEDLLHHDSTASVPPASEAPAAAKAAMPPAAPVQQGLDPEAFASEPSADVPMSPVTLPTPAPTQAPAVVMSSRRQFARARPSVNLYASK